MAGFPAKVARVPRPSAAVLLAVATRWRYDLVAGQFNALLTSNMRLRAVPFITHCTFSVEKSPRPSLIAIANHVDIRSTVYYCK